MPNQPQPSESVRELAKRIRYGCSLSPAADIDDIARLIAERERPLVEALKAVLLFHAGGPWDWERAQQWNFLVAEGRPTEVTTKVLCDKVRAALAKPGRWNPSGNGLEDLTFVGPGATSVLLKGGCNWHGFVKNGDAT